MNSFMSWVGGKKALREEIVRRFPLSYERYIEVFGGGGWVLFHKPPGRDFEVYNDFNSLLANLYRCVRDRHEELIDSLRYVLNSREDFELIKQALARDNVNLPEGQREAGLGHLLPTKARANGATTFAGPRICPCPVGHSRSKRAFLHPRGTLSPLTRLGRGKGGAA